MKYFMNKKGSAIITAIGLGIVLLIVIAAVHTFTSYRTQTVVQESKKVKALGLAEAGLELAIGELYNNANFVTHEVKINDKKLEWGSNQNRENSLDANSNYSFSVDSGSSGTLSGSLGDGKFKVRVGNIPYKDDENTKTIDERKSYVRIESMGIYDKTVRKIIAVVNRRYPTREFLMYDGGVLSLIYGQTTGGNTNVFATGHLYGHEGIELGKLCMASHGPSGDGNGTQQKLNDISAVLSGAGGIFLYSDIDATFKNRSGNVLNTKIPKNTTYPTHGTYSNTEAEKFGEMCSELKGTTPSIPDNLSTWVKDKNSGISIPPTAPSFEQYKKSAQQNGKFYSASSSGSECCNYRVPTGWSTSGQNELPVVYLDFGNNTHAGTAQVPSNGIIYSEKDIVIKGNPPKDLTIVSEKNVFVAGDFNQAGNFNQENGQGEIAHRYGFPQDYQPNKDALTGEDYCQESKELFQSDAKTTDGQFKYHVSATVIGKERVVYDHRNPVDCCENEIIPYLKYELAKEISVEASKAEHCLSPNNIRSLTITASDTIEGFNESIASFTKKFRIGAPGADKTSELQDSLKSTYESCNGSFDYDALDKMTLEVWKAYAADFNGNIKGSVSASGANSDNPHGIVSLIGGLRNKMCGSDLGATVTGQTSSIHDNAGDYLFFPEITTNGMFVSCGKMNNTCYCGPDVDRYYDEIGFTGLGFPTWYKMTGLVHRVFGSETYLRLYDVPRHPKEQFNYVPPTRKKIYDDTLPMTIGNNNLELTGFVILSWQELGGYEEEFNEF